MCRIERNISQESTFSHLYREGTDRQASEDNHLFEQDRGDLLLHRVAPIHVEYICDLLLRIHDCDSEYFIWITSKYNEKICILCHGSDLGSMLQSITTQVSDTIDSSALMKAMVFYMAVTVEAFIFCFCGEYLSAKVGTHNWSLQAWFIKSCHDTSISRFTRFSRPLHWWSQIIIAIVFSSWETHKWLKEERDIKI